MPRAVKSLSEKLSEGKITLTELNECAKKVKELEDEVVELRKYKASAEKRFKQISNLSGDRVLHVPKSDTEKYRPVPTPNTERYCPVPMPKAVQDNVGTDVPTSDVLSGQQTMPGVPVRH